jgi:hypothetical protein
MDVRIRNIVSKSAGIYFIVTDNRQVVNIEAESKMRIIFINSELGGVNALYMFAKGDVAGFQSIFGKASRSQEKKGNFSHQTCLDAIKAGPIGVINLRSFNNLDVVGGFSVNPNGELQHSKNDIRYDSLFTTNSFWVPNKERLVQVITGSENDVLQFGNIGTSGLSIMIIKSSHYSSLTSEGEETLENCSLEIDEFPALDFKTTLLKDTFVDVYVFANDFNPATVSTNPYYGQLFNDSGEIKHEDIPELSTIKESGFLKLFTGSIIPGLKNEINEDIAIDNIINLTYMSIGLLCNINDDVFEQTFTDENPFIDLLGISLYNLDGEHKQGKSNFIYSHVAPDTLTKSVVNYPPVSEDDLIPQNTNLFEVIPEQVNDHQFIAAFEQGLRIGDELIGQDGVPAIITEIEILEPVTTANELVYTPALYTVKGNLLEEIESQLNVKSIISYNLLNIRLKVGGTIIYNYPAYFEKGSTIELPFINNNKFDIDVDNIYLNGKKIIVYADVINIPNIEKDSILEIALIPDEKEHNYNPLLNTDDHFYVSIRPIFRNELLTNWDFFVTKNKSFKIKFPENQYASLDVNSLILNNQPVLLDKYGYL